MSKFTLNDELRHAPFSVPADYFETLAFKKEFVISGDSKSVPFVVPENYFEAFEVHKSFILNPAYRQNPFIVPANYFETFEVRLESAFESENKAQPFAIPADYFESLQTAIADKIAAGTPASPRVVQWRPLRAQLAYAASFLLLIAMGLGIVFTGGKEDQQPIPALVVATQQEGQNVAEVIPAALQAFDQNATIAIGEKAHTTNDAIIQYLSASRITLNDIASLYR